MLHDVRCLTCMGFTASLLPYFVKRKQKQREGDTSSLHHYILVYIKLQVVKSPPE